MDHIWDDLELSKYWSNICHTKGGPYAPCVESARGACGEAPGCRGDSVEAYTRPDNGACVCMCSVVSLHFNASSIAVQPERYFSKKITIHMQFTVTHHVCTITFMTHELATPKVAYVNYVYSISYN